MEPSRRRELVALLLIGGAVFAAIALAVRQAERAAVAQLVADAGRGAAGAGAGGKGGQHGDDGGGGSRFIEVRQRLQAMQLVTIVIDTKVTSSKVDESWRGDVRASVTTPVRLLFGTDLKDAAVSSLDLGPLVRGYSVTLPVPRRLGTELATSQEEKDVSVGWLRFRTRAGEYVLGEARRGLSDAADRLELSREEQREVREQTRLRVQELVRLIAGSGGQSDDRLRIRVTFNDEQGLLGGPALPAATTAPVVSAPQPTRGRP